MSGCCGSSRKANSKHPIDRSLNNAEDCNGKKMAKTNGHQASIKNLSVAQVEMCYFCFDILYHHLYSGEHTISDPIFSNSSHPIFVTWNISSKRNEKDLRGCIGTFSPIKLHSGLKEYAMNSALNDSRFNPISKNELSRLHCSVSVLTNFEAADHWQDWEIGIHGIRIELQVDKGRTFSGTFLPEVSAEQGWTKIETIDSLLRKAGYRSQISEELRDMIKLTRYQSEKVSASHDEYVSFKNGDFQKVIKVN